MSKKNNPTVKTWKGVEKAVGEIGFLTRDRDAEQSKFDAAVEKLRDKHLSKANELNNQKVALERAVEDFVLAHRDELEGSTHQMPTGSVQIAKKPPSVVCVEGDEVTLQILKRKNLDDFIRVKESVNKTAIRDAELDKRQLKAIKVEVRSSEKVNIKPTTARQADARPTAA